MTDGLDADDGADSVLYHELTVAGRADDPVARAADYYASRGETPMTWGGSGAALVGLSGEVDLDDYRAVFGPGRDAYPDHRFGVGGHPACDVSGRGSSGARSCVDRECGGDERRPGGWKGVDNALLRDHLHAATALGRMAAAAKAVELGYGIEADDGRSGRLGSWAITGIPDEVSDLHSIRSRQIDQAVGADASYRSRNVAGPYDPGPQGP